MTFDYRQRRNLKVSALTQVPMSELYSGIDFFIFTHLITNIFFVIVSPIPEIATIPEKGNSDLVSAMCQQLSQGLSLLSSDDFSENKTGTLLVSRLLDWTMAY